MSGYDEAYVRGLLSRMFTLNEERDEEHGWAVIATERAQRAEAERDEARRHAVRFSESLALAAEENDALIAERDALQALVNDLAAGLAAITTRSQSAMGAWHVVDGSLSADLLARLDAAATDSEGGDS